MSRVFATLIVDRLLTQWDVTGPDTRSIVMGRALVYLAGRKHSEFLQLLRPRKRTDLRFLLAGPLLLTQARSGWVTAPGYGIRGGPCRPAGLGLMKPGLRGGLCSRVRHNSSLTFPLKITTLTSTSRVESIKFF